jgi:PilZ domain-containing protein
MQQRRAHRVTVDQTVEVTIYGEQDLQLTGVVKSASALGLTLEVPVPIQPGTAMKIRLDDTILLGEAVHGYRTLDSYTVGIRLEQALNGLAELARALGGFQELRGQVAHTLQNRNGQNHQQNPKQ